jgi:hypothetical protein
MSSANIPTYRCTKIDRPLRLDGTLQDPLWEKAVAQPLYDIHGRPGRFKTSIRTLYNDTYLYLGYECEDDYVWGTITERNGSVWEQECVEAFLNPGHTIHQYYEINVSPLNTVFDACIINGRTEADAEAPFIGFPDWDVKDLHTAVHVEGELQKPGAATRWCVEMAIPFAELFGAAHVPPHPGDTWRANFYRIDQPNHGQPEHYAWSKVDKVAFHLPWRFGILEFA